MRGAIPLLPLRTFIACTEQTIPLYLFRQLIVLIPPTTKIFRIIQISGLLDFPTFSLQMTSQILVDIEQCQQLIQ